MPLGLQMVLLKLKVLKLDISKVVSKLTGGQSIVQRDAIGTLGNHADADAAKKKKAVPICHTALFSHDVFLYGTLNLFYHGNGSSKAVNQLYPYQEINGELCLFFLFWLAICLK